MTDAEQAEHVCATWATIINTQTGAARRLSVNEINSDQLDALYERLANLEKRLGTEEEISGRLLDQRQELAAERYAWQERGDRAETSTRAHRVAAIEALVRAEQAEATIARVRGLRALAEPQPQGADLGRPRPYPGRRTGHRQGARRQRPDRRGLSVPDRRRLLPGLRVRRLPALEPGRHRQ